MKIGILSILFDERPLEGVLKYISSLGYEAIELPVWEGAHHINIDQILSGNADSLKKTLEKYSITISALSNHPAGQLVLGPLDSSTDIWFKGTSEEKVKYGMDRMKKTAEAAAALNVPVVNGFIGAPNWGAWYIFPPTYESVYEKGFELFAQRWGEIMDTFNSFEVKFAHEVHPQEQAYNIETSKQALKAINYNNAFGFNFDPSHFIWQSIDPVLFIKSFPDRIYHVHAKDGELVKENLPLSGSIPTGSWQRSDRGFRFRVPGWGDVPWKRVITALAEVGYDYVLSYEHEDPIIGPEEGCEKCIQFLKPLLINKKIGKI